MNKKFVIKKIIIIFFIVLVSSVTSFAAGIFFASRSEIAKDIVKREAVYVGEVLGKYKKIGEGRLSQDIDFDLFWQTWDALTRNYVDKDELNEKQMFYGALRGMVSSLGDPYTVFMDPKISQDFSDDLAGTFEGIGAEIGIKNDVLTIIAPLPDMPAEKAGLKAGDKVLFIDDKTTMGIFIDEAVNLIRGPKGTEVKLSVSREGEDSILDINIKRGKIIVKSIRTEMRGDDIYVLRIINFNDDTEQLFNQAVSEIIKNDPKGIILDLRNNPGGYLDTAIEVASEWVEDGVVVVEQYNDKKKFEHLARGRARLKDFSTIVLVNEGSASASEIVSGALQDYDKAKIIGMHTFGKGSVQTLTNLNDGSSIKITVAKWLTPEGRSINDEGILPDLEVDLTREDYENNQDPQIKKAIELLLGKLEAVNEGEDTATGTTAELTEDETEAVPE